MTGLASLKQPLYQRRYGLSFILVAFLVLGLAGCDSDATDPGAQEFASQTVSAENISDPVAPLPESYTEDDQIYYLIFDGEHSGGESVKEEGPTELFRDLLDSGVPLEEAWYPVVNSIEMPCAAPNVHPALVVKLGSSYEGSLEEAFQLEADPRPVHPNCGIEEFEHYTFTQ